MKSERRKMDRRTSSCNLSLVEATSSKQIGIMADISPAGFKLDSAAVFPKDMAIRLRLNIPPEFSSQPSIVFTANSKWSHSDSIEPYINKAGFEITAITPEDALIYQRVFELCGSQTNIKHRNNNYQ